MTEPGRTSQPSAAWATYTTEAYASDAADEGARATAAWLEEQSTQPFIREVAERSLARLALQPGESILEVGCGTGVFLPRLAGLVGPGGRVAGLDHAPAFLDDARKRVAAAGLAGHVELVEGDAGNLPFADDTFDAAHCERVLMHLADPDRAIAEMRRVVRPGGRVVAAEVYAAGAAFAGADPELNERIMRAMTSAFRNPWMGLELRGRFVDAGLTEVGGEVVGDLERELVQDEADEIASVARDLAARGEVDTARVEAALADLEARRARGAYGGLAFIVVVSGRVPVGEDTLAQGRDTLV